MSRQAPFADRIWHFMCITAVLAHAAGSALAVPILGEPVTVTQPDGSTFVARAGGDEWFNWVSHDGALIVQNEQGWWCYARLQDGGLQATALRAGVRVPPAGVASTDDLPKLAEVANRPPGTRGSVAALKYRATTRHVLVVLVEFTDQSLSTSDTYWTNIFFGSTGKTVRTYLEEVSGGACTIAPAAETSGTANDGVVRVQLNASDYNAGQHPDPTSTVDDRNRWIVYDALMHADASVSFGAYDTAPNDGYITPNELDIVTVVAGYEWGYGGPATPTPSVIGHRWSLNFTYSQFVPAAVCDGVSLCGWHGNPSLDAGYMQMGELHTDHPATISVPCHEFGHELGLPDLYDLLLNSDGIGGHGLMGYGNWGTAATDTYMGETPVHMCAWSKTQLGFVSPTVAAGNQDYTLYEAGLALYNVVKVTSTQDPNQYFLIENRQMQGFDAGLYRWFSVTSGGTGGGGLAIWHMDDSVADNNTETHKKVDLEEANEGTLGWSELDYRPAYPQDPVPYQGNRHHYYYGGHVTAFGDATTPNSRLYDGRRTNLNVSSVSAAGPAMKCYIATRTSAASWTLDWSTFLGGWASENAMSVVVDEFDNVYVGGATTSSDFPTTPGVYDRTLNGYGAMFVAKFNSAGAMLYSTLLDSPGSSYAPSLYKLGVDASNCTYLTGKAYEAMPTTGGAYDTTYNGGYSGAAWGDAFVAKFDASAANLVYCTYLGGADYDAGFGIAADASGNAYVAGATNSTNFPHTLGSFGSGSDVFVAKLNPTGSALVYSRLFGATTAGARDLAIDGLGNAYVTGWAYGTFPTTVGAWDTTQSSPGFGDVFATKLGTTGNIDYSTYLGGNNQDEGEDIVVDSNGYMYVTGFTGSADFPTTLGADEPNYLGRGDAFATKLHPTPYSGLTYSTFVGSTDTDHAYGIDLGNANEAHVGGYVQVSDQSTQDAFLVGLNPPATGLAMPQLYFGGAQRDAGYDIAVDHAGAVYIVGYTESSDYPTTAGAYDTTFSGTSDAFVTKLAGQQVTASIVLVSPDGGEVWRLGRLMTIQWSQAAVGPTVKIELSRSGYGGSWETLYAATANDGSEAWTVSGALSSNCVIRVSDATFAGLVDTSNAPFAIAAAGDLDGDGDIDLDDYSEFADCLGGSGAPIAAPGPGEADCNNCDLDGDGDVDLADFAQLQLLYGP